ncbi:MAG: hypothetical protein LC122_00825 [Chitinophagales bacterium]|nr:hypothetical protein [Chitinophagales bacterium]
MASTTIVAKTKKQKLNELVKQQGIVPGNTKKNLEKLKKFWQENIGLSYNEVRKNAWR